MHVLCYSTVFYIIVFVLCFLYVAGDTVSLKECQFNDINSIFFYVVLTNITTELMLNPVSYTHLDVYKRQVLCTAVMHGHVPLTF